MADGVHHLSPLTRNVFGGPHRYLTDPYDVAAMIEICKTTMKMTETPSWKKMIGEQFVHPSMPEGMELNSDEFYEWLVRTMTFTICE